MKGYVQYVIPSFHDLNSVDFIIIFSTILVLLHYRRTILELLIQSHVWGTSAVVCCVFMTSGHMWNVIQQPAFSLRTKDGPVLITNNKKRQFLAESYIVAILNATIVIGMILSIDGAKRKRKRRLQFIAGLALMAASFVVLLAMFRVKRPHYHYGF